VLLFQVRGVVNLQSVTDVQRVECLPDALVLTLSNTSRIARWRAGMVLVGSSTWG
jgi:hypothetical protein